MPKRMTADDVSSMQGGKRILVLGGTNFVGRHFVQAAIQAGHEVTLFNWEQRNPQLFPHLEHLHGDRLHDVSALADQVRRGRRWDVVFDANAYLPEAVERTSSVLRGAADGYVFMSTLSVYRMFGVRPLDEGGAVQRMTDDQAREAARLVPRQGSVPGGGYAAAHGPLKVRCEEVAERFLPGRTLIVRPGFIVGPHDYSARFPTWVRRLTLGGEVLAPGDPSRPVRLIDARDLAEWIIRAVERQLVGVFNASGAVTTMGGMLDACRDPDVPETRLTWIPDAALLECGLHPLSDALPFWTLPAQRAVFEVSDERAVQQGLTFRPLSSTAADTRAWLRAHPEELTAGGGLYPGLERRLLKTRPRY